MRKSTINLSDPQTPIGTIFLRDITVLDCGVFDPCQGILGQSWFVDLEISGHLDEHGLVYDFGTLKRLVRTVLKENLDHALVIPIESKSVKYSDQGEGETWTLTSQADKRSDPVTWIYQCPKGAVYPIRSVNLDKNVIASSLSKSLGHRFPDTITSFKVKLREEKVDPTEAVFRYTHGIANHEGLCQRLFHGHRSCIEVYLGDVRRPDLEQHVVWQVFNKSVHIASQDQLITKGLESGQRSESSEPIEIGYQTAKGTYRATLPANKVFVVDHQTSIEQIATTLATVVRNEIGPTDQAVKVVCYEGIEKGAIAKA